MDVTDDVTDAVSVALEQGRARLAAGRGSLAVRAHGSHVLVGPLVVPDGQGGCADCALAWWTDVAPHTAGGPPSDVGLDWAPVVRGMVARVLADEPAQWRRAVLVLDRTTGVLSTHRFVPHPACVVCAVPPDPPAPLDLTTPQPALGGPLRTLPIDRGTLREHLLDERFGPVVQVDRDEATPPARVRATVVVPGRSRVEHGAGRATSFIAGEVPAVLGALGRVLGGHRRPAVPVVVASYDEVADHAVDPRRLGTHEPGHPAYEPFARARTTSWVWGYSTREDREVLVPEHVAYRHEKGVGARFVHESSTGCAVGGSREEAVLHGLLDVVERDAAMLAWYTRARLVEIETSDELASLRDVLAERGMRLRVLDLTSDFRVPVALAVAVGDEDAVRRGQAPARAVGTGVGADPRTAVRSAAETCTALASDPRVRRGAARCRPALADHDLVRTPQDHVGLHALADARPLGAFLDRPVGFATAAELATRPTLPTGDVARALRELLARTHTLGLDVVVVDQSAPELVDALGLHAVKVLVPGTVPLTHGHRNRRTVGLPRLACGAAILHGGVPWDDDRRFHAAPHPFP